MKMVGKQGPGIDIEIPIQAESRQPVQKIFSVLVRAEYCCAFDASPDDMM
jgi:hypothetical protein